MDDNIFNRTAWDMLRAVERVYLEANGWVQPTPDVDEWENEGRDRFGVSFGHAVNIQKHADRIFASALYTSGRTSSKESNLSTPPREERDFRPYLEAIEEKPFSPTGSLYTAVFQDMVAEGLATQDGSGAFWITDKGREVLRRSRFQKEQPKEKP